MSRLFVKEIGVLCEQGRKKMISEVTVRLGSTEITVNKNGFGALPIQRISDEDAIYLLRKA